MFDYDDEFNAGGYDGFGRDDDYNIWEENQLAQENESGDDEDYYGDDYPGDSWYLNDGDDYDTFSDADPGL